MVWYWHVFQNFPQFIVIHTVRGFGIVNKAEIDVFLKLSCFFNDPADVSNLISGSQVTPGVTGKFGLGIRNEAGQRLIEFCQENALVIVNTLFQQHKRRLYTWTSPDGQYWNQSDYILCSQRWRSSIQSGKNKTRSWLWLRSWTPYCKFRLKLKKVGKTTRPFRYDLNQAPYN